MWAEDYKWHYDYVRLAWDIGFSFNKYKSVNLDKNKICVVDVDRIVRERDVASVDRFIATVVQYILDDEQARVLDINFVKIFRLSQLAVEFLLFCKKYLDNTVVLLKKELTKCREESKELKTLVEDLQLHIYSLNRQQALPTFKCVTCSKAFASEEYLNAHIKRRHGNHNNENYNAETDKLNLEIKQLKERLNNAEKILKEKEQQRDEKVLHENNGFKMNELLEKFEQFKGNVGLELKELKMQKIFYEEKYGKLFDIVINSKDNIESKNENIKEISKAETTTQTDKLLHIENVQNRNVLEIQEPISLGTNKDDNGVPCDGTDSFKETKKSLESKISTTLAGIEDQMQAFWNKLHEIERTRIENVSQPDLKLLNQDREVIVSENSKPKIKPRSKLSQPTHNTIKADDTTENLKFVISKLEQEQKKSQNKNNDVQVNKNVKSVPEQQLSNICPKTKVAENWSDGSKIEEESSSELQMSELDAFLGSEKETDLIKPSASRKRSIKGFSKITSDTEVLKNLNKEIQEVVLIRLQELGISKSWAGLPRRSFEKSLETLNHQAILTRKTYSNFEILKKKINANAEKCARTNSKTKLGSNRRTTEKKNTGKPHQLVKISYRPKSQDATVNQRNVNVGPRRDIVTIKNRALFDTDTESERNFKAPTHYIPSTSKRHQLYSDVVNEFKSLSTVKFEENLDSDLDDMDKKEDLQKGVLKSFPSVGSLSKKKVIFDLDDHFSKRDDTLDIQNDAGGSTDDDFSKREDALVTQKGGGSTTSVASSILELSDNDEYDNLAQHKKQDESKSKESQNKVKEKNVNDLSDCDFSDFLDEND